MGAQNSFHGWVFELHMFAYIVDLPITINTPNTEACIGQKLHISGGFIIS